MNSEKINADRLLHNYFAAYASAEQDYMNGSVVNYKGEPCNCATLLREKGKSNKPFTVYIIGAMSQMPYKNIDNFIKAKTKLAGYGIKVVIPHEVVKPDTPWLKAVSESLGEIRKASVVCVLEEDNETPVEKSYGLAIERMACWGSDTLYLPLGALCGLLDSFIDTMEETTNLIEAIKGLF